MSISSIRTLRLLMPLSAAGSSLTQMAAIFTNHWLFTMELMPNEKYERFKMPPEMEYLRKYTESGMLQLCQNQRKCCDQVVPQGQLIAHSKPLFTFVDIPPSAQVRDALRLH